MTPYVLPKAREARGDPREQRVLLGRSAIILVEGVEDETEETLKFPSTVSIELEGRLRAQVEETDGGEIPVRGGDDRMRVLLDLFDDVAGIRLHGTEERRSATSGREREENRRT